MKGGREGFRGGVERGIGERGSRNSLLYCSCRGSGGTSSDRSDGGSRVRRIQQEEGTREAHLKRTALSQDQGVDGRDR